MFLSQQVATDIAHTFNIQLWYDGSLSKDKIWTQTRPIQKWKCISTNWSNSYATAWPFVGWDKLVCCWLKYTDDVKWNQLFFWNATVWRFYMWRWNWNLAIWTWWSVFLNWPAYPIAKNIRHHVWLLQNWTQTSIIINGAIVYTVTTWSPTAGAWTFIWQVTNLHYSAIDVYDFRIYNWAKTLTEITEIMNWKIDLVGLASMYKMDEKTGTTIYDSSWNNEFRTLFNWVNRLELEDWFGSDFQNQYWYTDNAWVLIPRNEAIPTQDVQWNPLQYTWRVKYDAELIGRWYGFDWINDYISLVSSNLLIADFAQDWEIESFISIEKRQTGLWRILSLRAAWSVLIISVNARDIVFAIGSPSADFSYRILPVWWDDKANFTFLVKHTNWWNLEIFINWNLEYSQPIWSFTNPTTNLARIWSFWSWDVIEWKIWFMRISYQWYDTINLKMNEWSWIIAYDSSWNWRNGTFFNWVQHTTWKWLWDERQTEWYTQSWLVSIPRDDSNPTLDVLWNPLQYPWDWYSLLPSWQVDFNPWLAPELIRKTVPTNYTYWDALPATMTKKTGANKENNFIVLS